jgi:hypothetical protein
MMSARKGHEREIRDPPGRREPFASGWSDVVQRFAPYVHAVARAHRLPEPDAEWVFTEVFVRTWAEAEELTGDEAIRTRIIDTTRQVATERRLALGPIPGAPSEEHLDGLRRALMVSEALRGPATQTARHRGGWRKCTGHR